MQRTKSLTTNALLIYKIVWSAILSGFIFFLLFQSTTGGLFHGIFKVGYFGFIVYYLYQSIKKLKYLEYDDKNLYVKHKDYQIQIPFEEIKDVEIVSLDGVYKFTLYQENQIGKEILCKTSIWYPLNYNKVDDELNRIRSLIRKQKQRIREMIEQGDGANQLYSQNL